MNKKGFTLIELVTVIALLGIIAIIAFVSIFEVIKKNKVSDCNNLLLSIKSAAKDYVSDNRYNVVTSGSYEYMNLKLITKSGGQKYIEMTSKDLIDGNYLSSNVKNNYGEVVLDNPFGETNITPSSVKIRVYLNDDYSASEVNIYNNNYYASSKINCENEKW